MFYVFITQNVINKSITVFTMWHSKGRRYVSCVILAFMKYEVILVQPGLVTVCED